MVIKVSTLLEILARVKLDVPYISVIKIPFQPFLRF